MAPPSLVSDVVVTHGCSFPCSQRTGASARRALRARANRFRSRADPRSVVELPRLLRVWDAQLRDTSHFTSAANRLLIEAVARRRPGSALDLLMGQGRNALHLARRGWSVTGIDRSAVGVALARRAAAAERLAITIVHADVTQCELGDARWD